MHIYVQNQNCPNEQTTQYYPQQRTCEKAEYAQAYITTNILTHPHFPISNFIFYYLVFYSYAYEID